MKRSECTIFTMENKKYIIEIQSEKKPCLGDNPKTLNNNKIFESRTVIVSQGVNEILNEILELK